MKKLLLTLTLATIFSFANAQQATPCDGLIYDVVYGDNLTNQYGLFFTNFTTTGGLTNIANTTGLTPFWSNNDYRSTQVVTSWADGTVNFSASVAANGQVLQWGIWIDTDNDGAFSDAEKVYYSTSMAGNTVTGAITIASTLAEGSYNMRIVADWPNPYFNIDTEGACGTEGLLSTGFNYYGEVEDYTLTVGPAPACFVPTDITLTASTTTTADFTFTDSNDPATNDYEYQLIDVNAGETFDDDAAADGTTTTTSIGLTSLTPANYYSVRVRTTCPGDATATDWSVALDFNTPCPSDPVAAVDEDFDATSNMPVCFETIVSGTGNAFAGVSTASSVSGANSIRLNKYPSTDTATLVLPYVTTLGDNYRLNFNIINYSGSGSGVFNVGTVDADGTFTSFQEITITSNVVWESQSIDFSSYAGTDTRVAITGIFNATSYGGGYLSSSLIDDVVWEAIPSCLAVSDITYTSANTDGTSSDISWTENGTASNYNIEVYEAGADTSTATPVYTEAVVGATNTTVTGLTAYTFYDAYVQADCGFSGASASVMQEIYTGHCNPSSEFAVVGLDNVTTAGGNTNISNTASGFSTGGYGDFRTQAITGLVETQSFTITLDQGTLVGGKMYGWVDWNNDLVFDNTAGSSEIAFVLDNGNYSSATFTVTIPDGQAAGDYVLRVKVQQLSDGEPCGDMIYGEVEDYTISVSEACSWNGATSTDWATGSNWSTGAAPTSSDTVLIKGTFTNEPSISSTDAVAKTVIVTTGNTLTIDETSSLTVSGDFTNTGTVSLNSTADDFSSLIVTGTATGDIVYNRYVNVYDDSLGGGWDLVCSPVGMSIADFITANGSNIQVLGDNYAFSQFNNATGQWERYATASQTGNFEAGKGYSMATTGGSTVAFTGAMQTADQSINIINNNGLNGVGRRWNLVSNPFPSYILGNTAAGTNNFMDANSAVIDSEFLAVYGWNGSSYTIYNNLSGAFSMAPGQGFWVAALNTTDTALSFTADMRTNSGTGDFVSGPQLLTYNVAVKLYNGETEKATTDFYFRDGLSLDLDPGYDAAAFNQSMALSTRLPQGSQETAFGINAMGMDAMQNTRVPLEIRQNAGQAFRVSIADMELPEDIYVYLEDTLNGTLTSLKDGDFELVAQSNLSGSDRFFIVFKSNSVLSNGDTLGINALNVYKANTDSFVTIAGISPELGKLNVSLYNILGQTVREKALSSATATQTISTDGLASGLYIVQIRSGNQVFIKKIIVE
ncbi:GEVED domain-containing protein, partial [Flavobacteriaceae bacterium]|nr:GEVED domain-containing protein [Flavobacteriaceae bacterium]